MLDSASPGAVGADADGGGTSCMLLGRPSFKGYKTVGIKVEKESGRLWERFENYTNFISPRSWRHGFPFGAKTGPS